MNEPPLSLKSLVLYHIFLFLISTVHDVVWIQNIFQENETVVIFLFCKNFMPNMNKAWNMHIRQLSLSLPNKDTFKGKLQINGYSFFIIMRFIFARILYQHGTCVNKQLTFHFWLKTKSRTLRRSQPLSHNFLFNSFHTSNTFGLLGFSLLNMSYRQQYFCFVLLETKPRPLHERFFSVPST